MSVAISQLVRPDMLQALDHWLDTTYNYTQPSQIHAELGSIFELVMYNSVAEKIFGSVPVPVLPSLEEVEGTLLTSVFNTKVVKYLEFTGGDAIRTEKFVFPANWIQTEIQLRKTDFESGVITTIPSRIKEQKASDHAWTRDGYVMRATLKDAMAKGFISLSAAGTIQDPDDCNSTPGTAETGGIWTGSQQTAFQFDKDVQIMKMDIMSKLDSYGKGAVSRGASGNFVGQFYLLLHPLCKPHLDRPVYNGSYYLSQSYAQYLEATTGVKIIYTEWADANQSYTGADAATTEAVLLYEPAQNFFTGVIQGMQWEAPWGEWMDPDRAFVLNRLQEKLVAIIRPWLISGTYYKLVAHSTITPYDNTA